jgi:hypothetical protein
MDDITESAGYRKLLDAVERDEQKSPGFHNYRAKLEWAVSRAKHYAEHTGLIAADILNAWEERRNYWYMNYYQDGNMPEIKGGNVRIFETQEELRAAVGKHGFRCPACNGVSKSPYECDTGIVKDGKPCDWKSYGLFGTLGKGASVFVKSAMAGENVFMPVAFETHAPTPEAS